MPCRTRETRESSLAVKFKGCGCNWGFSCSHSKSRSSRTSSSSSSLTRHRSSSKAIMCCSDGCAYLDDLDFFEPCIVPPPKHVQFGGQHFYGPSFHHHDHHHGHHGHHDHKYSSDPEHIPLGDGGGQRHTMTVEDMTDNTLANDRGTFFTISFPLRWKGHDLLQRLTSNNEEYAVSVQSPFGSYFELKKDMNLKKYLYLCGRLQIVRKERSLVKHIDF